MKPSHDNLTSNNRLKGNVIARACPKQSKVPFFPPLFRLLHCVRNDGANRIAISNRLYTFFLLFLIVAPAISFAAVIQGKTTDSKGIPLPFATVFVKGTTIGTSSNALGDYSLTVNAGSYQVVCQYIGFSQSSFNVSVKENEMVTHNFSLTDQNLTIKEFTVKASEDPAKYIMRQVIKRRVFHLNQIEAFQTDMYLKGVLRTRSAPDKIMGEKVEKKEMGLDTTGKGILFLVEENATYYTEGKKEKTVIHSVRQSGSPNGLGFSQFPPVINFYANSIRISDQLNPRGFISPISDNAFNYYDFKLLGDFAEDAHTIFKIKVTPKRLYEPLFSGTLYVVDNEWAIHSLEMLATNKNNMELLDSLLITQLYLPLKADEWVIKQQVWYPVFKFFGFDFNGSFVTVYDNQKINAPIPDSIFNKKIVSVYDKTANKKDSAFWEENRPIPLAEEEVKDFVVKDSIRKFYENPAYRDSMRRRGNRINLTGLLSGGLSFNTKEYKTNITTNALFSGLVNYNTIEGWNTAPKVFIRHRIDTFHYLNAVVAARYGFSNKHFNSIGKIAYTAFDKDWRSRSHTFEVEGGKYVFQFNPYNPIEPLYNTIATLFYRQNYLKIYERWDAALAYRRNMGNGFRYGVRAVWQQRLPLTNSTDFSFAKTNAGGFTENFPAELKPLPWVQHNAFIATLSLEWQPGYTYTQFPDFIVPRSSGLPTFSVRYDKGIPNILGSKTDYDKWRVGMRNDVSVGLLGSVSYNLAAGGFFNTNYVSIPDLMHLNGNQVVIASPYLESFQLAPYYTFSNQKPLYGEAHLEWYLKGFLTNKIPLLRQLRWYLVTGTNSFYAGKDLYHAEAFVGIDNLGYKKFRLLRADVVWGWNSLQQRLTAIRIGISPTSLLAASFEKKNTGEW